MASGQEGMSGWEWRLHYSSPGVEQRPRGKSAGPACVRWPRFPEIASSRHNGSVCSCHHGMSCRYTRCCRRHCNSLKVVVAESRAWHLATASGSSATEHRNPECTFCGVHCFLSVSVSHCGVHYTTTAAAAAESTLRTLRSLLCFRQRFSIGSWAFSEPPCVLSNASSATRGREPSRRGNSGKISAARKNNYPSTNLEKKKKKQSRFSGAHVTKLHLVS